MTADFWLVWKCLEDILQHPTGPSRKARYDLSAHRLLSLQHLLQVIIKPLQMQQSFSGEMEGRNSTQL